MLKKAMLITSMLLLGACSQDENTSYYTGNIKEVKCKVIENNYYYYYITTEDGYKFEVNHKVCRNLNIGNKVKIKYDGTFYVKEIDYIYEKGEWITMNTSYITVWVRADLVKYFFLGEIEGRLIKPEEINYSTILVPNGNLVHIGDGTCYYTH